MDLHRIGVVGCGLMGSGIAEVCARAGLDVLVAELSPDSWTRAGPGSSGRSTAPCVTASSPRRPPRTRAHGSRFTTDLGDLADRDLVVEAVAEDEQAKLDVFATLDKVVVRRDAILASNTSAIPIMKLAMATSRPDRVIGIHFFNPVPVLPSSSWSPPCSPARTTAARAESFLTDVLGKQVIRAQDRAGFVVNALLVPYLLSAVRMLESGFASAEDIDNGMVLGCAHPMGPLRLLDLIGLDTDQGDRRVALRRVQGAALLGAAVAAAHGRCRAARQEERPRLLRLLTRGLRARG